MIRTLGHLLLSAMFIRGGADSFMNPDPKVGKVDKAGVPMARQATILQGAAMVLGGTALAVGFLPKLAALVLVATLIPTTFVGHPYWQEENPANRAGQQIHFFKNLAMLGGLLVVLLEKPE